MKIGNFLRAAGLRGILGRDQLCVCSNNSTHGCNHYTERGSWLGVCAFDNFFAGLSDLYAGWRRDHGH